MFLVLVLRSVFGARSWTAWRASTDSEDMSKGGCMGYGPREVKACWRRGKRCCHLGNQGTSASGNPKASLHCSHIQEAGHFPFNWSIAPFGASMSYFVVEGPGRHSMVILGPLESLVFWLFSSTVCLLTS